MDRIGVSFLDPLDDYELIHRIGCGTYGDVFKVSENISSCVRKRHRERGRKPYVLVYEDSISVSLFKEVFDVSKNQVLLHASSN